MNIVSFSTSKLCRYYLIHSMIYYHYDNSVIPDFCFDELCKELLQKFEEIPQEFKEYITKENLEAGTGFGIAFSSLPQILRNTAYILHSGYDFSGNKINYEDWVK